MSLSSALNTGAAGLKAGSSAVAGVADNIANMNTVGYKAISTEFNTLVVPGLPGSGHVAGGVTARARSLVSRQGALEASGVATNIGIDGAGFFVVRDGAPGAGQVAFTRAGNFAPDPQGFLRNSGGFYLQGWRLDSQGLPPGAGLADLEAVRLSDFLAAAEPTTTVTLRGNLDAGAAVVTPYVDGQMASGQVAPAFARSVDVYDAQGVAHRVEIGFLKTGANSWKVEIYARPASDVTAPNGLLRVGTLVFKPDGTLDPQASSPALFQPFTPSWANSAGSDPITLDFGTNGGLEGFTQFGSPSALSALEADGGVGGNVSSIAISDDGIVSGVFGNGRTKPVFQLPIATFRNPDGLTSVSGNAFVPSEKSGGVLVNTPGQLGSGKIAGGFLEASTVDLAGEFTNMIRFQRAYSASSRIVTTVDEMLQEINALKR